MPNYTEGLVSVIMPTYKRSEKLERAINSVLAQTYNRLELIVVNDNMPDDEFSKELVKKVKKFNLDHRFHLIFQKEHINGAVARNIGIKKASGEYVAFLDDDDWWKRDKLEKQVEVLRILPKEWGCVSCRIEQYNNNTLKSRLPLYSNGFVYKDILMQKCDFATGTLLFRHDALDCAGYFDENLFRNQDWQLLINFTSKYKLFQVDDFLHCCDISDGQNRPNGNKAVEYKKSFLNSINSIFNSLTKSEQKCVMSITNFEIGYVYYREGNIYKAFRYCINIFKSPRAVVLMIIKLLKRRKSIVKI